MEKETTAGSPSHVEHVLAVNDISETILYWHHVLGFPDKWTWGEPPDHGGVSWSGTFIQFSKNPKLASASKGNAVFIRARKLEALYHFHQNRNAEIVEPLENKPWGMAGYTIKDINGYHIIFAGDIINERKEKSGSLPSNVKVTARLPTTEEYKYLASSVGWSLYTSDAVAEKLLKAPVFAVVAEDEVSNKAIGCALILGDHVSFYYIKDVIVHPEWQARNIGTAMMKELSRWLENNAADNALAGLITPEALAPFYQQFGFAPAFCMVHYIQRNKE
ncbi:MAG: GNAT family N-acetyltransferase [Chitinophagaceae bacterium]|nr:GNAT family N-acetyltransferase [Chitinophagaceae bacterium]